MIFYSGDYKALFDVRDNPPPPCIYEGSEPPKNFALKTWPNLLVLYITYQQYQAKSFP